MVMGPILVLHQDRSIPIQGTTIWMAKKVLLGRPARIRE